MYMQRVRSDGMFQLPLGGVELTEDVQPRAASGISFIAVATGQDFVGAFAHRGDSVWHAERFDSWGARIWSLERSFQGILPQNIWFAACNDGRDGIFTAKTRAGLTVDRIDAGGTRGWGSDGFPVPTKTKGNGTYVLSMAPDGHGGVYIMYFDQNPPGGGTEWIQPDTWIQRVSSDGIHWFPTGRLMCRWVETFGESMSVDGLGNIVVLATEEPHRNRLRVQKFSPAGSRLWDTAGVLLYQSSYINHQAVMLPDDAGGHFIAWYEYTGTIDDPIQQSYLRVQRIDEEGRNLWGAGGIQLASGWMGLWNGRPQLVRDNEGGVIVLWYTGYARKDSVVYESDIYMQRLDGNGRKLWGAEARPLCDVEGDQEPVFAVSDANGGAHVLWGDGHKGKNDWDVYYTHVAGDGRVSTADETSPSPTDSQIEISPSVVYGSARITMTTNTGDHVRVSVHDLLGREVAVLYNGELAQSHRSFVFSTHEYSGGSYRLVLQTESGSKSIPFIVLR
ncbi:MAG: hypothetical protein HY962_06675 [Ignavibacteriae bacterium]|nr:hypothetical protein [Ignavibacteriota bacterium]